MPDALDLIADLRARGFALTGQGRHLTIKPRDGLTEADIKALLDNKLAVIAALANE